MDIKEKAVDLFGATVEVGAPMACELIFDSVIGTVAPGVMDAVLAYKQKRQERMYTKWLEELKARVDELEAVLKELPQNQFLEMKEKYFGMISDYVLEEVQEEKIKFLANGLINLSKIKEINENFVLTYYDTLQQLRMTDIAVLNLYGAIYTGDTNGKTYLDILKEFSIDDEQYRAIREKLERLGLIVTKREDKEDDLYKNIAIIQSYLESSSKGKKATLSGLKKLEKNDSYKLSRYGRLFLQFFIN